MRGSCREGFAAAWAAFRAIFRVARRGFGLAARVAFRAVRAGFLAFLAFTRAAGRRRTVRFGTARALRFAGLRRVVEAFFFAMAETPCRRLT
jgi:hypothetical protein